MTSKCEPMYMEMQDRVTVLEKRVRRQNGIIAVIMALFCVGVFTYQRPGVQDVVAAKQFLVVDSNGKVKASLGVRADQATLDLQQTSLSSGGLLIRTKPGESTGMIVLQPSMFVMNSTAGNIFLTPGGDDGPNIRVAGYDSSAAVIGRARLSNTGTGSTEIRSLASIVLFGQGGKVRWTAP